MLKVVARKYNRFIRYGATGRLEEVEALSIFTIKEKFITNVIYETKYGIMRERISAKYSDNGMREDTSDKKKILRLLFVNRPV